MHRVRIATYNLWSSDDRFTERLDAACEELSRIDADILALQEVRLDFPRELEASSVMAHLQDRLGYPYAFGHLQAPADSEDQDQVILSKHPMAVVTSDDPVSWETRVIGNVGSTRLAVTNVHLDWRSIVTGEDQILRTVDWIEATTANDLHEILLGDFNCHPESSVYRFLRGQQSIVGRGTTSWHDLARLHAIRTGTDPSPTLDFEHNPRWRDNPVLEIPARCDWILVRDGFETGLQNPHMESAGRFGLIPAGRAKVVPSDHYGVYADLLFPDT